MKLIFLLSGDMLQKQTGFCVRVCVSEVVSQLLTREAKGKNVLNISVFVALVLCSLQPPGLNSTLESMAAIPEVYSHVSTVLVF